MSDDFFKWCRKVWLFTAVVAFPVGIYLSLDQHEPLWLMLSLFAFIGLCDNKRRG